MIGVSLRPYALSHHIDDRGIKLYRQYIDHKPRGCGANALRQCLSHRFHALQLIAHYTITQAQYYDHKASVWQDASAETTLQQAAHHIEQNGVGNHSWR